MFPKSALAAVLVAVAAPAVAQAPPTNLTFAWRGRSTANGDLVALLMPQQCAQPNGETAPYRVWISLPDGAAVTGCCR
jgi:hypothetical protein